MVRRWLSVGIWGFLGVFTPFSASASMFNVTVSTPSPDAESGVASNTLTLGVGPAATSAFDISADVVAFPSPVLTAAVRHPEYLLPQQWLWWDLRSDLDPFPQSWTIEITSNRPNAPMTLTWSSCAAAGWSLSDITNASQPVVIDVASSQWIYQNQLGVTKRVAVSFDGGVSGQGLSAPINLWSPRLGRSSVYLAWSGSGNSDLGYHVYRETSGQRMRVTAIPLRSTSYVDSGLDLTIPLTYRVTAVDQQGCESAVSAPMVVAPRR